MHHDDLETAEKMLATSSGVQVKYLSKRIREKVHLRAEWNKQRRPVMYCLVAIEFREPKLRKWLLDTHQSPLQESVKSQEGYCRRYTYSGQPGQNMQGQVLMQVRHFIRMQQNPPTVNQCSDVTRVDHMIKQSTTL